MNTCIHVVHGNQHDRFKLEAPRVYVVYEKGSLNIEGSDGNYAPYRLVVLRSLEESTCQGQW